MASYRPSKEIAIAEACGESWEAMPGDARVRHCGVCERDVLNVAAMTPAQLEEILAQAGPLPCMRLVQMEDGGVWTANEVPRPKLYERAAAMMASVLFSVAALAQQKPVEPELQGYILDPTGTSIPGASILLRQANGTSFVTKSDGHGNFHLHAAPGEYVLSVESPGFQTYTQKPILLREGSQALPQMVTLGVKNVSVGGPMVTSESLVEPVQSPSFTSSLPEQPTVATLPLADRKRKPTPKPR